MGAVNANHIQRMIAIEFFHDLYERLSLFHRGSFSVATALHLYILTIVVFNFPSIVETVCVGQIYPKANFYLSKAKKNDWSDVATYTLLAISYLVGFHHLEEHIR